MSYQIKNRSNEWLVAELLKSGIVRDTQPLQALATKGDLRQILTGGDVNVWSNWLEKVVLISDPDQAKAIIDEYHALGNTYAVNMHVLTLRNEIAYRQQKIDELLGNITHTEFTKMGSARYIEKQKAELNCINEYVVSVTALFEVID